MIIVPVKEHVQDTTCKQEQHFWTHNAGETAGLKEVKLQLCLQSH